MRRPMIAGNWKLFKTVVETEDFISAVVPLVEQCGDVDIVVAPVFTVLAPASRALVGTRLKVAAQDCFWEDEGAFTGEIAPRMLRDVGCTHVIIGHSERRQYFGETDETVRKKTAAALSEGLVTLVCVGETLEERETGATEQIVGRQVRAALYGLQPEQLVNVVIAYEPVWAIGTGKTASDEQAQAVHAYIRQVLSDMFNQATANSIRILYGGSVKPENIKGLMSQPDIDGALVGGASLKPESFARIVCFES